MLRHLAYAIVAPLVLLADPKPHVIDKAHSQINFVAEARFISAHGFFANWDADLQIDPAVPEASRISITIDAASINTRVDRRDNHLRSKDFFDAATYPKITFVSSKLTKRSDKLYDVAGDLTIRGTTKAVVVPTKIVFYESGRGRVTGQFVVNRKEYGVSYDSKANPIEDEVQVQFSISFLDKVVAEKSAK
ncbi:MAG: YceI family protein [Gemmatimonadaceae bacterium]